MKKNFSFILVIISIILLTGCNSTKSSFSSGQQKAIKNSIKFIKNSNFTCKDVIDTKRISIEKVHENNWMSVFNEGGRVDKEAVDSSDWVVTIGDTTFHDFARIVCDSETYQVIGHIPID